MMLKSIKRMFDEFEKNKIMYCHWKSNEHLESALNGDTDLDVLFLPSQRNNLEIALGTTGLKRFKSVSLMAYNAVEDYIGYDYETAKIWHLHLHYRLTLGEKHLKGYTLPWMQYLISRRVLRLGVYTSNPSDEFFLLLVRIALKIRHRDLFRNVGEDDIRELEWLKGKSNIDELYKTACRLTDNRIADEIIRLAYKEIKSKKEFLRLRKYILSEFREYTGFGRCSSFLWRSIREVFWLLGGIQRRMGINTVTPRRRISPSGGTVVVFLGCDGAGKSTTLSYVSKEFMKKIDVYQSYMGSGDGSSSIIRKPMKFIAKRVAGKGIGRAINKEVSSGRGRSLKSRLYLLVKIIWAITLAVEKRDKLKQITRARNKGMLVLVDRYPQIETMGYSDGPLLSRYCSGNAVMRRLSKWEYTIYKSGYKNPPDLVIKLTVPTQVALQRKPEMSAQEIEDKKKAVSVTNLRTKETEIDTSCELNVSVSRIMQAIWDEI